MKENPFEMIEKTKRANSLALMMTFADLMSILMAFFILLYALSEVDRQKFKLLGQSLQMAFGNTVVQVKQQSPMQDNIVDNLIQQNMNIIFPLSNQYQQNKAENKDKREEHSKNAVYEGEENKQIEKFAHTQKDTKVLKYLMAPEIENNFMEIQQKDSGILISINTQKAFKSGSADFTPEMKEKIGKLSGYLNGLPGKIVVKGHTDNVPISNNKYRSNWELAAGRAYSVIDAMVNQYHLDKDRFHLEAYADTQNIAPNDTEQNRSQNRRIEILVDQSAFYNVE